jgi:hypothetical protein
MADLTNPFQSEVLGIDRQKRLAEMLLKQGMAQNNMQGQMVSGRFVGASPWQGIANLANIYVGKSLSDEAEQKQAKLAQDVQLKQAEALRDWYDQSRGRPAVEAQILDPKGQATKETTADMFGADMSLNPAYKQIAARPAIEANPELANMRASENIYASPVLRELAMKKLGEGPKWQTLTQYNEKTGNTENYRYNENSPNPRETMQFIGIAKPALTASETLHLNDQGIGTGRYGGSAVGGGTMPTVGGNAPNMGGTMPVAGSQQGSTINPAIPTIKPVASTNAPVDALVTTYGYDPFKPPPMPQMPSGSAARAWKADIYKPLDGTPANTVTGATTYVDALGKYNDYVNTLSAKDLTNPQVRTKLDSLYSTVKLTGKEANNLGVLNGGDEKILEAVVPNYSNILVTKKTVQKILDEQKEFGSSKIVSTYRTAQKPVPENMRKYVVVPKVEEPVTGTPKATGATARAVLNGRQIEVRGGKWVDSNTGEEVR